MALAVFCCCCQVLLSEGCLCILRIDCDLTSFILVSDRCCLNSCTQCSITIVCDRYCYCCRTVRYCPALFLCVVSDILCYRVGIGSSLRVLDLTEWDRLLTFLTSSVLKCCFNSCRHWVVFFFRCECENEVMAFAVFCCCCQVLLSEGCLCILRINNDLTSTVLILNCCWGNSSSKFSLTVVFYFYSNCCTVIGYSPALFLCVVCYILCDCVGEFSFLCKLDFSERNLLHTGLICCIAYSCGLRCWHWCSFSS